MFFLIILRTFDVNSNAFLILTHKPIDHIYKYAEYYTNSNFYIHVDKKVDINFIKTKKLENIYFLNDENRVDISWASFSMVQATLNLMEFALEHDSKNSFFHLISGDDVIFDTLDVIPFDTSKIYIECYETLMLRYRVRFNTPHAGSKSQRKIYGKALTYFFKVLDKFLPTSKKYFIGSQWFSISNEDLKTIVYSKFRNECAIFFKNKLCPDEHFFQYLILKCDLASKITNNNKRYIVFDKSYQNGSSPRFLDIESLKKIDNQTFWFSRKVQKETINLFLQHRGMGLK